jgi:hypothetical protein
VDSGVGGDRFAALESLLQPPVAGGTVALRVALLASLAVVSGVALVRPALGRAEVSAGVLALVRVAGPVGAACCLIEALTGQAERSLCAALIALLVGATLLLPARSRGATWLLGGSGALLVGALAVGLSTARVGLPMAVDIGYAVFGALLVGASVFGAAVLLESGENLVASRLAGIALVSGVVTAAAGIAQLALAGPRDRFDLLHTGYGLASAAQAAVPVLVTLAWLVARQPVGRVRGAELSRLGAGAMVLVFLTTAALATLPKPPVSAEPGQPLLRPVELGIRHLVLLVTPMRPGPNLVHIGDAGGGQTIAAGPHAGMLPAAPVSSVLTVSAGDTDRGAPGGTPGGTAAALASRPGAPGYWTVLNIPAGTDVLTVSGDGISTRVPVDVGTDPGDGTVRQVLAGADGPECASAALGALVAGRAPAPDCPSQRLSSSDAQALSSSIAFLAGRGITTLELASDSSPRSQAAQALVRAEAAKHRMVVAGSPTTGSTLFVVSGWAAGARALTELSARAGDGAYGGTVLAPWLLSAAVLGRTTSEVLPLLFDPRQGSARSYSTTLASAFPGETPSTSGYLAWSGRTPPGPLQFYGVAQVNVPMGGAMDDMPMGGGLGSWYPSGAIVPIASAPVGSVPASEPDKVPASVPDKVPASVPAAAHPPATP